MTWNDSGSTNGIILSEWPDFFQNAEWPFTKSSKFKSANDQSKVNFELDLTQLGIGPESGLSTLI